MKQMMNSYADIISYQSTLKNVTLYTSPYLVAHNKGYTKHFYAGSERVCAAIGEGGLNNLVPCIGNNQTLKNNANNLFYNTIGAMGDRLLLENDECLRNDKNTPKELLAEFENVAVNVQLSSGVDAGTFHNAINKYCSQDNANSAVYYYHSDHLGSASWITNTSGSPVQHLQYMPYGEPLVNERTSSYEERFTFTGKERDSETGFSYFGARYYDSDFLTGWLSVDPLADKYPSLSPYAYCAWNPVKLVDPDGEEIDISALPENMQNRLVNSLCYITGLKLSINDGRIEYSKDNSGNAIFENGSESARNDLIAAIDAKNEDGSNYAIKVGRNKSSKGGVNDDRLGGTIFLYHDLNEEYDKQTNGIGMIFMHELSHAFFGDKDPEPNGKPKYSLNGDIADTRLGDAVVRVNKYRRELNLPIRVSYIPNREGYVPFIETLQQKNGKTKTRQIYLWME